MSAVADVQAYLEAQGHIGGTTGWASRRRAMNDDPNKMVAVSEDGSNGSELVSDSGLGSAAIERPGVIVSVRGEPWQSDAAYDKASGIRAALHSITDVMMNGTVYMVVRARTDEPLFAGFDDKNRPIMTISFTASRSAIVST